MPGFDAHRPASRHRWQISDRRLSLALPWLTLVGALALTPSALAAPGAALSCPPSGPTVLHVGPGGFATLGAAVAAASNGDTICVAADTYANDFVTTSKNLTIRGVGGLAHFVQTVPPGSQPNGKAFIVTSGNLTIEALEFSGAKVSDGNGAGIRYEGGTLTVRQSYFHDNQDGILGGIGHGDVTIADFEVRRQRSR